MGEKRINRNKWWYWLGGALLVLVIVMVVVAMTISSPSDGQKDIDSQETDVIVEEEKEVEDIKTDVDEVVVKEEIEQYDGENPNEKAELSGAIIYAEIVDEELIVRVNIDQYLDEGVCSLTLWQGGSVIYSDAAGISAGATTATCEGFNVKASELTEGVVRIEIDLSSGEKTGRIIEEVEI